ncbi:hypothetical protein FKX85_18535 [Echinicola soli]|uniref:Transposase n=1 Tax=Echinicola soli TaxID=2591634 RepID=A0A514CM78_9BACT|nr:hypothetical protein [Echinicola soli]QDH80933.1 hypothetical protein FKX85_18535 [Echinicola soli]
MKSLSSEDYYVLYEEWKSSGQTKAKFAESRDLSRSTFYYWARKIGRMEVSPGHAGFDLLEISPRTGQNPAARICYPSGVVLEFYGLPDPAILRQLTE